MPAQFEITLPGGAIAVCRQPSFLDIDRYEDTGAPDLDAMRWAVRLVDTLDGKAPPALDGWSIDDVTVLALAIDRQFAPSDEETAAALASVEPGSAGWACDVGDADDPLPVTFAAPTVADLLKARALAKGNRQAEQAILTRLCVRTVGGRAVTYEDTRKPSTWPLTFAQSRMLVACVVSKTMPNGEVLGKAEATIRMLA